MLRTKKKQMEEGGRREEGEEGGMGEDNGFVVGWMDGYIGTGRGGEGRKGGMVGSSGWWQQQQQQQPACHSFRPPTTQTTRLAKGHAQQWPHYRPAVDPPRFIARAYYSVTFNIFAETCLFLDCRRHNFGISIFV